MFSFLRIHLEASAGSDGNYGNIFRNCQTVFLSGCPVLPSPPAWHEGTGSFIS